MKKVIITAGLLLWLGAGSGVIAQTGNTGKHTSNKSHAAKKKTTKKTSAVNKSSSVKKSSASKKDAANKRAELVERKVYMWEDGQAATPTGHEATGVNDNSYSALKKPAKPSSTAAKSATGKKSSAVKKTPLKKQEVRAERRVYMWKDGQAATPTGHEATSVNGNSYSAMKKNSVNKKQ